MNAIAHAAPPVHFTIPSAPLAAEAALCAARVFIDSHRTQDIVTAEEIVAQEQLKYLLGSGLFESEAGRRLFDEKPDLGSVDLSELRKLPASTLGGAYARFFEDYGLTQSFYGIPANYTSDPEAGFLMVRIRQCHDLWHVLTGLNTDGHEEILLHAWQLAQTGLPASIALMVLGSIKHMVLEGRFTCLTQGLRDAYDRGATAERLLAVRWEDHFEDELDDVRARYGIVPFTDADRARWARFH